MTTLEAYQADTLRNLKLDPIVLDSPISIDELPTPALVIDLDKFDRNLSHMCDYISKKGMGLRCHTKMHKCPIIAKKQIEQGALGVCCATVSEAEVMLAAGITNILITSPVVTTDKLKRVIKLAEQSTDVAIVVDYIGGADLLDQQAKLAGITLQVIIDLDPGLGRTGITPGEPTLALAKHITEQCSGLHFTGLQMYIGNCMHIDGFEKRKETYLGLLQNGIDTKALLEAEGITVDVFTGGGTGSFDIDGELGALTDLQGGSFVFMDVEYRDIGGQNNADIFDDFEPALFVLATAISKPQERMITMDAGIKSLATDTAYPEILEVEGVKYYFGGDEHGMVRLNNPSREIMLGDRLHVITPHCDPTVNLYDVYYPVRNGMVSEIWPISARGRSQ